MSTPESDLHALVTEVRLIRAELEHVNKQNETYQGTMAEIFDRLRRIESTIAVLHATKPTRTNAWAIVAVVISGMVALVTVIESVSLQ